MEYTGITFACLVGAVVPRHLVLTSLPESGMAGLCEMACDQVLWQVHVTSNVLFKGNEAVLVEGTVRDLTAYKNSWAPGWTRRLKALVGP